MKENCLNIKLNNVHVMLGNNGKHRAYQFIFYNWIESLVIIYIVLLDVAFRNKAYFEFGHKTIKICLNFVDPLGLNGFPIVRERHKRLGAILDQEKNINMLPLQNANGKTLKL